MAFKMKGMKSFGEGTPLFQKNKGKNYESSKGDQQGPIPEQNIKSDNDDVWVYGRGYNGDNPKDGIKEMENDRKTINDNNRPPKKRAGAGDRFVEMERIGDLEDRKSFVNEESNRTGKKETKTQKQKKADLEREAEIMRDRSKNKAGKKSYYNN